MTVKRRKVRPIFLIILGLFLLTLFFIKVSLQNNESEKVKTPLNEDNIVSTGFPTPIPSKKPLVPNYISTSEPKLTVHIPDGGGSTYTYIFSYEFKQGDKFYILTGYDNEKPNPRSLIIERDGYKLLYIQPLFDGGLSSHDKKQVETFSNTNLSDSVIYRYLNDQNIYIYDNYYSENCKQFSPQPVACSAGIVDTTSAGSLHISCEIPDKVSECDQIIKTLVASRKRNL